MIQLDSQIEEKLRSLDVGIVYLFGSYAEGTNHTLSDLDLGIVFSNEKLVQGDTSSLYNQLYDLFTDISPGRKLDIVFLQRAGLEIRFDAIRHGRVVFEVDKERTLDFEEKTMILYADFKTILNEFDRVIVEAI